MSIADNWDDRSRQKPLKQGVDTDWKPKTGEEIGQLIIPRIGAILPIIEGTDEDELAKGSAIMWVGGRCFPGRRDMPSCPGTGTRFFAGPASSRTGTGCT